MYGSTDSLWISTGGKVWKFSAANPHALSRMTILSVIRRVTHSGYVIDVLFLYIRRYEDSFSPLVLAPFNHDGAAWCSLVTAQPGGL